MTEVSGRLMTMCGRLIHCVRQALVHTRSLYYAARLRWWLLSAAVAGGVPLHIVVAAAQFVLCLFLQELATRTVDADVVLLEAKVAVFAVAGMYCIGGP